MRPMLWIIYTLVQALIVEANTEKVIFVASSTPPPGKDAIQGFGYAIGPDSRVEQHLEISLNTEAGPHSAVRWYELRNLTAQNRYEVKICWPASVRLASSYTV